MADGASEKMLAFVYDAFDPQYLRVSIGGTLLTGGLLACVKDNAPDFKNISPDSGEVVYKLIPCQEGQESFAEELYGEDVSFTERVDYTLLVQIDTPDASCYLFRALDRIECTLEPGSNPQGEVWKRGGRTLFFDRFSRSL